MIPVAPAELARARAALDRVAEGPIFLQSNLARYGIGGDAPRAVHLWRNADWTAFAGLTNAGVLMPQMGKAGPSDWAGLPTALARALTGGQRIAGLNGPADQIARCLMLLDLPAPHLDRTEPCFALALPDLRMPPVAGLTLAAPEDADLPLLTGWRAAYRTETSAEPPAAARRAAKAELPLWLAEDGLRLIWRDGAPVALTGLNARHGDRVQVGGVYTPPALRGQGLARAAVALHLAQLAGAGTGSAFLFAASDAAARAYQSIGFAPAGQMRIVILPQPGDSP